MFNSAATTDLSTTYDSNNNKTVIAYQDYGNSNYGTAIVGTVSGSTITFGSETVFNSGSTSYTSTIYNSDNNKTIVAYRDD